MRRIPSLLVVLAVATAGCATGTPMPRDADLDLSRIELGAPARPAPLDAPGATEWQPLAAVATAPATTAAPLAPRARPDVGGLWISHVSLLGGGRWLDKNDWSPLEHQLVFGLEIDESYAETGNGYEVGALYAHDEDDLESTTYEVYGGYRYTFGPAEQELHPFVSLGVAASRAELDAGSTDDDTVFGAYARAGLLWDIGDRVRLGVDYRRLFADDYDFDVGGSNVHADADYDQVTLSLGYEF